MRLRGELIMKKKKYISPEMEIMEFDNEDVITTSNQTEQFLSGYMNCCKNYSPRREILDTALLAR